VTRIGFRRRDMLILSRKPGKKVVLGNGITLAVAGHPMPELGIHPDDTEARGLWKA
jgi:hypothetical protein